MNQEKQPVIMQILPALESGGVERGTVDIARALKENGFEAIVVSNGGALVRQLEMSKIKHIRIPVNTKNPLKIILNIFRISNLIKKNNVDIVHVRSRAPMISTYFACRGKKIKLVSTVHGPYSTNFCSWMKFNPKLLYNSFMLKADRVIAVSEFIKNYIKENYGESHLDKVTVIHRGADLKKFNSDRVLNDVVAKFLHKWRLPEDRKIILFPARFTSWKGHEFLLKSLRKVKGDFFCVMVGSDHGHSEFKKKISNQVIELGLAGKVMILGACDDMPTAYKISHLVISASVRPEAFGRVAIEAQSLGKIIIATKIGGALETVIDGKTGFLVDVNDTDAMAQLIDKVLSMTRSEVDEMGERARNHIRDNFSNEKMFDETMKVYKSLLGQNQDQ